MTLRLCTLLLLLLGNEKIFGYAIAN